MPGGLEPIADGGRKLANSISTKFRVWLANVDHDGLLAAEGMWELYLETFKSNFDSPQQVVEIYARTTLEGHYAWDPQFFADVCISEEHQGIFADWLERIAANCNQASGPPSPKTGAAVPKRQPLPPPPQAPPVPPRSERRVNPDDGEVYTWEEFECKYEGQYCAKDIADYWRDACHPVQEEAEVDEERTGRIQEMLLQMGMHSPFTGSLDPRLRPPLGNLSGFRLGLDDAGSLAGAPGLQRTGSMEALADDDADVDVASDFEVVSLQGSVGDEEDRGLPPPPSDVSDFLRSSRNESFGIVPEDDGELLRIDPEERRPCTFHQFKAKYSGHYSAAEIEQYWRNSCKTVLAWKKGR